MQNVKYILSDTCSLTLTPLTFKIKQFQPKKVTKKEEPLNLKLAEPSEMKDLHFLLVCVNENFKDKSLIDVELIQEIS